MPSGKVHNRWTIAAAPVASGLALILTESPLLALGAGLGCLSGIWLTNDLDQARGSIVWRIFWWPYNKAIPHRSRFSHDPILGTAGRLGYMYLMLLPVMILCKKVLIPTPFIWSAVAGLFFSSIVHTMLDVIVSAWKRKRRRRRNG